MSGLSSLAGGDELYFEFQADSDVRPVSTQTDHFLWKPLTRSQGDQRNRYSRCEEGFHKVLNEDRDKRYPVLTMDDGGGCPVSVEPWGALAIPATTDQSFPSAGQTAPIFGRNVCNKQRGQMEHPSKDRIFSSPGGPRLTFSPVPLWTNDEEGATAAILTI